MEEASTDQLIQERKQKVINFFKTKTAWISYAILAVIVGLAMWIRTRNVPGLKDVTTGDWTLGPDLDPFLFLRWAKYIVEHGSLFAVDMLRYVPKGFDTSGEYLLHPYMIAWFHNLFGGIFSWTVTQSAVYYPVFMFALTVIAFFFFTKEVFKKLLGSNRASLAALVASLFLIIMPALLPRTIAGIPEKESAAFLFLFLAFYFFIVSWDSPTKRLRYCTAALAGLSTACMGFIWGGYLFIFYTIGPAVLVIFLLGKMRSEHAATYLLWLGSSILILLVVFNQYSLRGILVSVSIGSALLVGGILIADRFFAQALMRLVHRTPLRHLPPRVISAGFAVILLLLLAVIVLGPSVITENISQLYYNLVRPAQSRLIRTVAENNQPYFTEWSASFGPIIRNIRVTFGLFFVGSIMLFAHALSSRLPKKQAKWLTLAYIFLISAITFTRYSGNSRLNGENALSIFLYALGFLFFIGTVALIYWRNRKQPVEQNTAPPEFGIVLLLVFFVFALISARGLVRLVMVLAIPSSMILGYLFVQIASIIKKEGLAKNISLKLVVSVLIIFLMIFAGYSLYKNTIDTARQYVPSAYTHQWQKAMAWVRDNTSATAVFGHWWDYGYWVQSIGERATVLDGGNAVSYWNHLMGRYALTGMNERDALEFLYAHNTTHFLIDSTDIGKYGAFSLIGSDENYDRQSWIPVMLRDPSQTLERKNTTLHVYPTGVGLDEDIIYTTNNSEIFLPAGKAALGGIIIELDKNTQRVVSINGIFVYQDKQHVLPLRYYYDSRLVDLGTGLDAGVFIFPRIIPTQEGISLDQQGALLYLSPRVIKTQLARLYLFGEEDNFKLAYNQPDFIVEDLLNQGLDVGDFIFFNEFRGPIKIWSINYPQDIAFKPEYLQTAYPESLLRA